MKSEQTNELRELQNSILKTLSSMCNKSDEAHRNINIAIKKIDRQVQILNITLIILVFFMLLAITASYFGYSELKYILINY